MHPWDEHVQLPVLTNYASPLPGWTAMPACLACAGGAAAAALALTCLAQCRLVPAGIHIPVTMPVRLTQWVQWVLVLEISPAQLWQHIPASSDLEMYICKWGEKHAAHRSSCTSVEELEARLRHAIPELCRCGLWASIALHR